MFNARIENSTPEQWQAQINLENNGTPDRQTISKKLDETGIRGTTRGWIQTTLQYLPTGTRTSGGGSPQPVALGSERYCNEPVPLALRQTPLPAPTSAHLNQLPGPLSGSLHSVSSHFKRARRAPRACARPGDRNICMSGEKGRRVSRGDVEQMSHEPEQQDGGGPP